MLWHTHVMFQKLFAMILFIALLPLFIFLFLLIRLITQNNFIFQQKRVGKNKKKFTIYKIQTMIPNAEQLQDQYLHFNQADGPVFKIFNDPRYTKIGKLLSKTGLDELPQLINIIKGEMAFVGPRPLPVKEAIKVPQKYHQRFSVLPGITSSWVVEGSHKLSFTQWMELDLKYTKEKTVLGDLLIIMKTIKILFLANFKSNK